MGNRKEESTGHHFTRRFCGKYSQKHDWSQFACGRRKFVQSMTEKIRLLGRLVRSLFWSLDFRKRRSEDLFWRRGLGNRQWGSIVKDILSTKEVGRKVKNRIVGNARAKRNVLVMGSEKSYLEAMSTNKPEVKQWQQELAKWF